MSFADNFYNIKQVSSLTDLTSATIYAQIKRGYFPKGTKFGGGRVWSREEVDRWLKDHQHQAKQAKEEALA